MTGILWVQFATSTAEAWLTGFIPSIFISPKKDNSPILTWSLSVTKSLPLSFQGWSLLENARVSPIKTPGDFASASPVVFWFKFAGSAEVTVPSNFISLSVVVSLKFLYFLLIKYFALSIFPAVVSKVPFKSRGQLNSPSASWTSGTI